MGYWVWDVKDEDDICGICQNAFDGVCGTCDEPGDQCPLRTYRVHSREPVCCSARPYLQSPTHSRIGSIWCLLPHLSHALYHSMDGKDAA